MSATISRFEARLAPCGDHRDGESFVTDDEQGLLTEDLQYACGRQVTDEEFHDDSVHRMVVDHRGRVRADEELRGE